jgi:hypothetical protein
MPVHPSRACCSVQWMSVLRCNTEEYTASGRGGAWPPGSAPYACSCSPQRSHGHDVRVLRAGASVAPTYRLLFLTNPTTLTASDALAELRRPADRMECGSHSVFEAECADHIPVVKTSVAGTTLVGRMTVGTVFPSPVPSPAHCVLLRHSIEGGQGRVILPV